MGRFTLPLAAAAAPRAANSHLTPLRHCAAVVRSAAAAGAVLHPSRRHLAQQLRRMATLWLWQLPAHALRCWFLLAAGIRTGRCCLLPKGTNLLCCEAVWVRVERVTPMQSQILLEHNKAWALNGPQQAYLQVSLIESRVPHIHCWAARCTPNKIKHSKKPWVFKKKKKKKKKKK